MVYANMVLARGAGEFAELLVDAGAAGAIVPDLPLDEAGARSARRFATAGIAPDPAGRSDHASGAAARGSASGPRASSTSSPTPA